MAIVLCTGIQPALMQTRKLILQKAGHTVIGAQTESEIIAACRELSLEVAIIGQSAQGRLKREWSALIRKQCPAIKILEVYTTSAGKALEDADEWLESPVDPGKLGASVAALSAIKKGWAIHGRR